MRKRKVKLDASFLLIDRFNKCKYLYHC